jgi:hypothetical protein
MMSAIAFKRIKYHKSQIVFIAVVLCICSMILLFCSLDQKIIYSEYALYFIASFSFYFKKEKEALFKPWNLNSF